MKNDVKQKIVDAVVERMNTTQRLPWDNGFLSSELAPINYVTRKPYRGVNRFMLQAFGTGTNEYVTYKQAQAKGGRVKKGEKGLPVVWYTRWNATQHCAYDRDTADKDDEVIPLLRYSTVFEISQCEGLEPKRKAERERQVPVKPDEAAEEWLANFACNTNLEIKHNTGTACYIPALHEVHIRNISEFVSNNHYYSVLFHECTHSTGHALGRKQSTTFGSIDYSKEEIIAEMGSLFMCQHFGFEKTQLDNSAAYLQSWGQKLKSNPDWLISGVNAAEKAYDHMIAAGESVEIAEFA